jgi:hypothetical protein
MEMKMKNLAKAQLKWQRPCPECVRPWDQSLVPTKKKRKMLKKKKSLM